MSGFPGSNSCNETTEVKATCVSSTVAMGRSAGEDRSVVGGGTNAVRVNTAKMAPPSLSPNQR